MPQSISQFRSEVARKDAEGFRRRKHNLFSRCSRLLLQFKGKQEPGSEPGPGSLRRIIVFVARGQTAVLYDTADDIDDRVFGEWLKDAFKKNYCDSFRQKRPIEFKIRDPTHYPVEVKSSKGRNGHDGSAKNFETRIKKLVERGNETAIRYGAQTMIFIQGTLLKLYNSQLYPADDKFWNHIVCKFLNEFPTLQCEGPSDYPLKQQNLNRRTPTALTPNSPSSPKKKAKGQFLKRFRGNILKDISSRLYQIEAQTSDIYSMLTSMAATISRD